jgi:hypothetical protein
VRKHAASIGNGKVSVWDPMRDQIVSSDLEGADLVVNLAGANIGAGRWTTQRKKEIVESRTRSTGLLARTLAELPGRPPLFLVASATGIYGNRPPDERVTENSGAGEGFLATVCRQWEQRTDVASNSGIRVINLRFGVVLSSSGGLLEKLLPVFRKGLGGKIGSGKQVMSWISIHEIPAIVLHLLENDKISGPVNAVTPNPVSNEEFTRVLSGLLGKPSIMSVQPFMIRMLMGKEMANELALSGARVLPEKLEQAGYQFKRPDLRTALEDVLAESDS